MEKNYPATVRTFISEKRSILLGLATFLILGILVGSFIFQRYRNLREDQRKEALELANSARIRLQQSLTYSLSAAKTLSFFIQPDGTVKDFDSIAPQLVGAVNYIDAVQLVPGGVIRYVYPFKGNEQALGYDILKDPARNNEAYKAIRKNEMFFAGPLLLKQGGMGVVGRLPIYRNGTFWGFSAVIIKMPSLLKAAGIDTTVRAGYYFQLSKINPDTKKEEFFIPNNRDITDSHSVSVDVPNGEWKLTVIPMFAYKVIGDIIFFLIAGILLAVLGGIFVYNESSRPKKLDGLVKIRTKQLKESEANYKALFEKSPLPLWIYNLETFKIIEVNEAAINLYGYNRKEFLGMDLRAIRPKDDIKRFVETSQQGSDTLREEGVWTYFKKNREEIQVLIFSRNINYLHHKGRLVLLMDVSEKVKIENELIRSEEKYRLLIEQASDGIILYSFDGTIDSCNKAAYVQAGYTREEFERLNMRDLFLEDDNIKKARSGSKLKQGETATLYRTLKKRDGSVFNVELNIRMLPDGKIISIVRDITEREKAERELYLSEQKYKFLFYNNPLPLWMISVPELDIINVNDSAVKLYGYSREEFLGLNAKDFRISGEVDDLLKNIDKMEPGKTHSGISQHKKKDGTLMEVETYVHEVLYEGKRAWLGLSIDISEEQKAKELLQKSYEDIRHLASNLQNIREEERTNIAREIHDELGQQLTGLKMDMFWLDRRIKNTDEEVAQKMKESISLINTTITTVRKIATDLRPSILDDLGLVAALEWHSGEFEKRAGIKVKFVSEINELNVTPNVTTALFRIYQELLTNIARHSKADMVVATLKAEGEQLKFCIVDNGVGFDIDGVGKKKTLGLLGIKERTLLIGGTYEIKSRKGKGSEVIITVPVELAITPLKT